MNETVAGRKVASLCNVCLCDVVGYVIWCNSFFNADVSASEPLDMSPLSAQGLIKRIVGCLVCVLLAACGQCDGERVGEGQEGTASAARLR